MTPLDQRLLPIAKLRPLEAARDERERLRQAGRKVVLTNGCFDLLHAGHIFFLEQAARAGDALFIALNSDASVRALKAPRARSKARSSAPTPSPHWPACTRSCFSTNPGS